MNIDQLVGEIVARWTASTAPDNGPAPLPTPEDPPTQPGDAAPSGNGHGDAGEPYDTPDPKGGYETPWKD